MTLSRSILCFTLVLSSILSYCQEPHSPKNAVRVGIGIGFNDGKNETGNGFQGFAGYQRSLGKKDLVRLNADLGIAYFSSFGISDSPIKSYTSKNLLISTDVDAFKGKRLAFMISGGFFFNRSTGTYNQYSEIQNSRVSTDFSHNYLGGYLGLGLRIHNPESRFGYEIKPLNVYIGNNNFSSFLVSFSLNVRL